MSRPRKVERKQGQVVPCGDGKFLVRVPRPTISGKRTYINRTISASIAITGDTYTQVTTKAQRAAAVTFDAVLSRVAR